MCPRILTLIAAFLILTAATAEAQLGTSADEAAIRKVLNARNAAYNHHDAKALAATYAPDADLVTGTGRVVSGRAAIEQNYIESFRGVDKTAVVKIESTKV